MVGWSPRVGRNRVSGLIVAAAFVSLAVAAVAWATPSEYHFRTLDAPGEANTFLYDLNDRGDAVGQGYNADFSFSQGVRWVHRSFRPPFVVAGASDTSLNSLNDRLVMTGSYSDPQGVGQAFLLRGSSRTDFTATPAAQFTTAGLNDQGNLAGTYTEDFKTTHAFTIIHGVKQTFSAPGADVSDTQAFKLNSRDAVVGWYRNASGSHGYVREGTSFTTIDVPGAYLTRAFGINNRDQGTGYFQTAKGAPPTGFIWHRGRITIVPQAPGATGTAPQGINDRGELAGYYQAHDGTFHGFIAQPDGD
ncbi:MAG: hypothetical protein QOG59_44 [Solirubrobacteraceae bacterium]|nr:hypothetical protein [Solirubrobacteraceae bacterium]